MNDQFKVATLVKLAEAYATRLRYAETLDEPRRRFEQQAARQELEERSQEFVDSFCK